MRAARASVCPALSPDWILAGGSGKPTQRLNRLSQGLFLSLSNAHFPTFACPLFSSLPFSPLSSPPVMSYGLSDVDGKRQHQQTAFASSSSSDTPSSGANVKSKNELANEYNPALRTPTGIHPLLVDELLPSDNYSGTTYWADLPSGGSQTLPLLWSGGWVKEIAELIFVSDSLSYSSLPCRANEVRHPTGER